MKMGGLEQSGRSNATWRQVCRWFSAPRQGGFTVIEVLVVLAVTALLFVSAALLIAGRQNRTAFEQAIRDVQSQVQKIINEVAIGYYPDFGTVNCLATAGGPSLTPTSGASQGINSGCVALGKVMQFRVGTTDPEAFRTYTIAGLRQTPALNEVSTYAEAMPKVVAPGATSPNVPDISDPAILQSGLKAMQMYWLDATGTVRTAVGAVGFLSSLAQYSGGSLTSGTRQINLVPIGGTALGNPTTTTVDTINLNIANSAVSPVNPGRGVVICFVSGGSDQLGLMTIGGQNRDLSVDLSIRSTTTCP